MHISIYLFQTHYRLPEIPFLVLDIQFHFYIYIFELENQLGSIILDFIDFVLVTTVIFSIFTYRLLLFIIDYWEINPFVEFLNFLENIQ